VLPGDVEALLDLKAHTFKGKEFHAWHWSVELLLVVAIALVTAASSYLNRVFAFAISQPGSPTSSTTACEDCLVIAQRPGPLPHRRAPRERDDVQLNVTDCTRLVPSGCRLF
jgi:hypothetical protein